MTRYLLDTDALIDFSKRREPAFSHILSWIDAGDTLAACAVTVAEFYAGLSSAEATNWEEFISSLTYWHMSPQAAMQAGQDRYWFARQGKTITAADGLIAATAREHQAALVTGNVKDYPMEDVILFPLVSSS
jgi:predicted nucleic acid-binding protein